MPEITSCPDCEKKLRVPDDLLGKKVRCPGCSIMFVAQAGVGLPDQPRAAAAPPSRSEAYSERRSSAPSSGSRNDYADRPARRDDYDDRPRRRDDYDDRPRSRRDEDEDYRDRDRPRYRDEDDRRPRDSSKAWRGVRLGLTFAIISGWLVLGLIGLAAISAGIFLLAGVSLFGSVIGASPNQAAGRAMGGAVAMGLGVILVAILLGLLALASTVLKLVGYGICLQVPASRNNSAKGLIIAAFSCACASLFLSFMGWGFSGATHISGGLSALVSLTGFILWMLFLRSVAIHLRGSDVARRIVACLIAWGCYGGAAFLLLVILIIAGAMAFAGAVSSGSAAGAVRTGTAFMIFAILMYALIGLAWLALYVWSVLLVVQVRGLVDRHLSRS
jgi:hypothetical protein